MKKFNSNSIASNNMNTSNQKLDLPVEDYSVFFDNEDIKKLEMTIEEKRKWSNIVKKIVTQNSECEKLSNCECFATNYLHQKLVRNNSLELELKTYYCDKYKLKTNYLIREFNHKLLGLSLINKPDNFIKAIEPSEIVLENALVNSIRTNKPRGLYLHGKPGIGKSYKIISYCNDMIMFNNKKVSYVFLPEIIDQIKNNFDKSSEFNEQIKKSCKEADILILDDFGAEYTNGWFYSNYLFIILNYRCEANLPVIFISNYSITDLKKYFQTMIGNDKKFSSKDMSSVFIDRIFDRVVFLADSRQSTYITKSKRQIKQTSSK